MTGRCIFVAGGDGFIGFPLSLRLSASGYDVVVIDSGIRRAIDKELGTESLTKISSIAERLNVWGESGNLPIKLYEIDVSNDYQDMLDLIQKYSPVAIIHLGQLRAAPYSMKSAVHKHRTIRNNICGTNNILSAIVESDKDIHFVHLGTMGVYGYGEIDAIVPEGYLDVKIQSQNSDWVDYSITYPPNPGSIYHMSKVQDHITMAFYAKNDKIRCTDLHQGVVWGVNTVETLLDDRLSNRFDYDAYFGTVLNRFIVQAAAGHPLTVYGTGGQTRAFINIEDSIRSIVLAVENPPEKGDKVKIINLAAEVQSVLDLAKLVSNLTGATIRYYKNGRNEKPENSLSVSNQQLKDFGLDFVLLKDSLMMELYEVAKRNISRYDTEKVVSRVTWNRNKEIDLTGTDFPQQ